MYAYVFISKILPNEMIRRRAYGYSLDSYGRYMYMYKVYSVN